MADEIEAKTDREEVGRIHWRLTQERAELPPPIPPAAEPLSLERWLRLQLELGHMLERELAQIIGDDRAYNLRAELGGFGGKIQWSGSCGSSRR
jgi:hypothetical protein